MEPELIVDYECVTGENPLWHPDEQRLYWVDLRRGHLYRYHPATGAHEKVYDNKDEVIGGFTIQADGSLLVFMSRGAVRIWREGTLTTVIDEIPVECESRFNDVIADPVGRVFCGTMPSPSHLGRLYRLDTEGTLTELLDGIGCSNGLGFTLDRKRMFYTDSPKREIYLFDYDRISGAITNQRVFVQCQCAGTPDGLTVDAEGYIWSAFWGDSCLVRYAPDGTEERRICFPAKKVSSLTFGGPDYSDIYVTTAGGNNKAEEGAGAGALFRITLGIQGVPEFRSRVGLSR
jgi:D-xylonolactonase